MKKMNMFFYVFLLTISTLISLETSAGKIIVSSHSGGTLNISSEQGTPARSHRNFYPVPFFDRYHGGGIGSSGFIDFGKYDYEQLRDTLPDYAFKTIPHGSESHIYFHLQADGSNVGEKGILQLKPHAMADPGGLHREHAPKGAESLAFQTRLRFWGQENGDSNPQDRNLLENPSMLEPHTPSIDFSHSLLHLDGAWELSEGGYALPAEGWNPAQANATRITRLDNNGITFYSYRHQIEAARINGQPLSLSFWVRSNKAGSLRTCFWTPEGNETFGLKSYFINTPESWQRIVINIPANHHIRGRTAYFYLAESLSQLLQAPEDWVEFAGLNLETSYGTKQTPNHWYLWSGGHSELVTGGNLPAGATTATRLVQDKVADTTFYSMNQDLPHSAIRKMHNKPVVLSFWVRSNKAGNLNALIRFNPEGTETERLTYPVSGDQEWVYVERKFLPRATDIYENGVAAFYLCEGLHGVITEQNDWVEFANIQLETGDQPSKSHMLTLDQTQMISDQILLETSHTIHDQGLLSPRSLNVINTQYNGLAPLHNFTDFNGISVVELMPVNGSDIAADHHFAITFHIVCPKEHLVIDSETPPPRNIAGQLFNLAGDNRGAALLQLGQAKRTHLPALEPVEFSFDEFKKGLVLAGVMSPSLKKVFDLSIAQDQVLATECKACLPPVTVDSIPEVNDQNTLTTQVAEVVSATSRTSIGVASQQVDTEVPVSVALPTPAAQPAVPFIQIDGADDTTPIVAHMSLGNLDKTQIAALLHRPWMLDSALGDSAADIQYPCVLTIQRGPALHGGNLLVSPGMYFSKGSYDHSEQKLKTGFWGQDQQHTELGELVTNKLLQQDSHSAQPTIDDDAVLSTAFPLLPGDVSSLPSVISSQTLLPVAYRGLLTGLSIFKNCSTEGQNPEHDHIVTFHMVLPEQEWGQVTAHLPAKIQAVTPEILLEAFEQTGIDLTDTFFANWPEILTDDTGSNSAAEHVSETGEYYTDATSAHDAPNEGSNPATGTLYVNAAHLLEAAGMEDIYNNGEYDDIIFDDQDVYDDTIIPETGEYYTDVIPVIPQATAAITLPKGRAIPAPEYYAFGKGGSDEDPAVLKVNPAQVAGAQATHEISAHRKLTLINQKTFIVQEKVLGSGAYGRVIQCYSCLPGGKVRKDSVARKIPSAKNLPNKAELSADEFLKQMSDLECEISVVSTLEHDHIVEAKFDGKNIDVFQNVLIVIPRKGVDLNFSDPETFDLQEEFAGGSMELMSGTLEGQLKKMNPQEKYDACKQMLEAIHFVAENGYIHFDIKPDNFLYSPDKGVKLSDFGLAKSIDPGSYLLEMERFKAAYPYAAPELVTTPRVGGYFVDGRKIDIWSLGMTFIEMFAGEDPMRSKIVRPYFEKYWKEQEAIYRAQGKQPPKKLRHAGLLPERYFHLAMRDFTRAHVKELRPVWKLIGPMIKLNPGERPTADQLLHELEAYQPNFAQAKPPVKTKTGTHRD